jgi:hypothetical protein
MGRSVDKEAKRAVIQYTRRSLVFIALRGAKGELDQGHGSGTVWRAASGLPVVLTAKHVVDRHRSFTVGTTEGHDVRLRNASVIAHADQDLALLKMPDLSIVELAMTVSTLSDRTQVTKGEGLLVSGYPKQGCFMDEDAAGKILRMGDISYFTHAAGSDAGTLSMDWKESLTDEATAALFKKTGMKAGRNPMKKPSGLSGGAVWLWHKTEPGELWSPQVQVSMIGIPHEFANSRQLAIPVWRWKEWLRTSLEQL